MLLFSLIRKSIFITTVGTLILFSASVKAQENASSGETFYYNDHGKRDPFMQLVKPSGVVVKFERDITASDLIVEGVMTGADGQNIAIINGSVVGRNEKIGMYVVKEIETNAVILQKGEEIFTINLKKEE